VREALAGTGLGQRAGHGPADPPPGTRDDSELSGEVEGGHAVTS
jgi:hypothetical protein